MSEGRSGGIVTRFGPRDLGLLARLVWAFWSPAHRRRWWWIVLLGATFALGETAIALAVGPYLSCLSGSCGSPGWLPGEASRQEVVIAASVGVLAVLVGRTIVRTVLDFHVLRMTEVVHRETVTRLLDTYLHMSLSDFRSRNQAHYFRLCAVTAGDAAYVTRQCADLAVGAMVLGSMLVLMLVVHPLATLVLVVVGGCLGTALQNVLGRRLRQAGQQRELDLQAWSVGMSEAFASFKEIRVHHREDYFLDHLRSSLHSLSRANLSLSFLPSLPRAVVEMSVLAGVLTTTGLWVASGREIGDLAPALLFFVVVARACLPALMNVLGLRAMLSGSVINLELMLHEHERAQHRVESVDLLTRPGRPGIRLEGVTFGHGEDSGPLLRDVDATLGEPGWTALVGPSGSGKSTLLELAVGLLLPDEGTVHRQTDGRPLEVAYVPQHVALLDGTVEDNVVLGYEAADPELLRRCLREAGLERVVDALPDGARTRIGANGTALSGGERQRLAIARALYRRPSLLILDETTSGLDEETERQVLDAIKQAHPDLSVVVVSHRPGVLRHVEQVWEVRDGRLTRSSVIPVVDGRG